MLVEDGLFAVILLGLGLGVLAIVAELLSWRSHQVATLEATAGLRALYQRTVKSTRRLATRSLRTIIP
jgi:hypothetical protein